MSLPLPPELRRQLDAFRRRLFIQETLWAAATLLGGILATLAVLFLLDRRIETPRVVRLLLLLSALAVVAYGAGRWTWLWVLRPRDDRRLSMLVQRKYRKLGDSLLSAIELAEGRITDDTISPELRTAAVAGVAKEAVAFDFVRAVHWRLTLRLAAGAGAGLVLAAGLGVACMPALRSTLVRLLNPFTQAGRYTFTRFKPLQDRVVARGEPFSVVCELDGASQWKPASIGYQVGDARPGLAAPGTAIALPGQTDPVSFRAFAGDASVGMKITPESRPALTGVKARVELPSYLRLPALEASCGSSLTVVEGARVALAGQVTRPLEKMEAAVQAVPAAAKPGEPAPPPAAPPADLAAVVAGSGFTLAPVAAAGEAQLTLRWTDTLGLAAAAPHVVTLKARPDQAPEARLADLASAVAMLPEEILSLSPEATDDFGVRELAVHCRFTSAKELAKDQAKEPAAWTERALPVAQGGPDKTRLAGEFTFSPKLLGIPEGSVVDLQAGASDYCPAHAENLSPVHRVLVLTAAEHAKMVQEMMSEASGKMDELANAEQQLREAVEALAKDPQAAATPEGARKLEELKAAEKANAEAMRKMEEKIGDIARQAVKNKDIPQDTLGKLAEMAKDMKEAAKASDKAAESMAKAQSAPSPQDKAKELEDAAKNQKEAEDKLRKNSKKMDEVQRKLDARNFINRLKREADQQDERTAQAVKLQATLLGAPVETLSSEERAAVQALAEGQRKSAKSAREIAADLAASYARSHHEPYHAVTDDMEKKDCDALNTALAAQFDANQISYAAGGGRNLAGLYRAWAKMLEEKGGGGGGGGGGDEDSLPAELLAAFMRMIEAEQDLREETRAAGDLAKARRDALDAKVADQAVDAAKADQEEAAIARETAEAAVVLAAAQEDQLRFMAKTYKEWIEPSESERAVDLVDPRIAGDYGTFVDGKRPLSPKVAQLMNAAAQAMDDAAKRLQGGHPDAPAVAAETEAVEILASIFDEGGKGGASKPSAAGQMAKQAAQKGRGKGAGQKPGMGKTGDGQATAKAGSGTHADPAQHREQTKTSGDIGAFVPPEFQGDIDAYHAEADKMENKP